MLVSFRLSARAIARLEDTGRERIAVPPLVECSSSARREESRVRHTEEAKYRAQIWLDKIERGHQRLRIIAEILPIRQMMSNRRLLIQ